MTNNTKRSSHKLQCSDSNDKEDLINVMSCLERSKKYKADIVIPINTNYKNETEAENIESIISEIKERECGFLDLMEKLKFKQHIIDYFKSLIITNNSQGKNWPSNVNYNNLINKGMGIQYNNNDDNTNNNLNHTCENNFQQDNRFADNFEQVELQIKVLKPTIEKSNLVWKCHQSNNNNSRNNNNHINTLSDNSNLGSEAIKQMINRTIINFQLEGEDNKSNSQSYNNSQISSVEREINKDLVDYTYNHIENIIDCLLEEMFDHFESKVENNNNKNKNEKISSKEVIKFFQKYLSSMIKDDDISNSSVDKNNNLLNNISNSLKDHTF